MTTYRNLKNDLPAPNLETLNEVFSPMNFEERIRQLYRFFPQKEVLFTSSFGTQSAFLLHLISRIRPGQPVHFIDTTFHFPETLAYKQQLAGRFGLNVIDVLPDTAQNKITAEEKLWKKDPGTCCMANKVLPLKPIKARHKVWISGLMAHQTDFRSNLRVFEQQGNILKFHPLIDIDEGEFLYYMSYHKLPRHPLEEKGYGSIGCEHCTSRGKGRSGRWKGLAKTECGLHPSGA
ncbi:MAG: phosphoadenylyl-sulfate reductase [Lewinellaceae bacterium]|nr:phosphoadenylyl-sulfate reductase [Lewinellaceae bacterium]MCB9288644.1 phosphoadenylyl-sulfate reductase [Lewinellaceae bacterium]